MNQEKMGQLIAELRKSKQMTQKELAARLNITDKAVSKWERGLSCPDIALLPILAETLGVTAGELLNGERAGAPESVPPQEAITLDSALQYAAKTASSRVKSIQNLCAAVFSALLLAGVAVCAICDLAITGAFSWSLFPIGSIVLGWLVFFPTVKFGERGIPFSLLSMTVLIAPYLYLLDYLIPDAGLLLPVGIRMAAISVVFLWGLFLLFRALRKRKLLAGAASLVLAIPAAFLINLILSRFIAEPLLDVWDILSYSLVLLAAAALFLLDYFRQKRRAGKA